jgi:prolipoprotein diacylglyceryl transferase
MLAFIPSPSKNAIHIDLGGLHLSLHMYGLMLAIGVLVAYKIGETLYAKKGRDPADIGRIAVVTVIGGVLGARVYHLFTGYKWDQDGIAGAFQIWKGGLSIWGVLAGGALAVVIMSRVYKLDTLAVCDALAPGIVVAQAIGRWGNWFNQELFGRPSTMPWALKIDFAHRPANYIANATFHPTFLYESLWCLLVFFVLVLGDRRYHFRKGQVFALYLSLYTLGRTYFEWLRVDPASKVFGVRFNLLLSAAICVASAAWFVVLGRRGAPGALEPPVTAGAAGAEGTEGTAGGDDSTAEAATT